MTTTINKTTTVRTTVVWNGTITDDNDVNVASMTARFDNAQPLGSYEFIVNNQSAYENIAGEAAETYATFQSEFAAAIADLTAITKETTTE